MSHVRWTYGALSVAICALLVLRGAKWAAPDNIDVFTYWCGAATLVALVVAVGEIIHAGTAASAVKMALSALARQEARTLRLEVIGPVDEVGDRVRMEDYTSALRAVQIARRFSARLDVRHLHAVEVHAIATQLSEVEHVLHLAMTKEKGRPMNKVARSTLSNMLMMIKSAAERVARLGDNV